MSCDVLMRFLVLCDVTWCTAMSCDVLLCDESCHLLRSDAAQWDEILSLWCDVSGCDVTSCGSSGCVFLWSGRWAVDPYYKVLQVLHSPYSKILQSTTPVLDSTTPTHKELLCTTKYYPVLQDTATLWYQNPKFQCRTISGKHDPFSWNLTQILQINSLVWEELHFPNQRTCKNVSTLTAYL